LQMFQALQRDFFSNHEEIRLLHCLNFLIDFQAQTMYKEQVHNVHVCLRER